jgi:hypothetical protein
MRVDLVAERPNLRGPRGGFGLGGAALGAKRLRLRQSREIESAPGGEEKEPGDRCIGDPADLLAFVHLRHARHGDDQGVAGGTLDADFIAFLDDDESLAGLDPEFFLARFEIGLELDDDDGLADGRQGREDGGGDPLAVHGRAVRQQVEDGIKDKGQ